MRNVLAILVVIVFLAGLAGCTGHMYIQDGPMIEPTDEDKVWHTQVQSTQSGGKKFINVTLDKKKGQTGEKTARGTVYDIGRPDKRNTSSFKAWDNRAFGWNYIQAAEAYRIKKQVDLQERMLNGLAEGVVRQSKRGFLIALVNNDPKQMAYIYHSEIPGFKIFAEPNGGFGWMDVRDIPYEIVVYRRDGRIIGRIRPEDDYKFKEKIAHKKRIGTLLVDYMITINEIYD